MYSQPKLYLQINVPRKKEIQKLVSLLIATVKRARQIILHAGDLAAIRLLSQRNLS